MRGRGSFRSISIGWILFCSFSLVGFGVSASFVRLVIFARSGLLFTCSLIIGFRGLIGGSGAFGFCAFSNAAIGQIFIGTLTMLSHSFIVRTTGLASFSSCSFRASIFH